MYSCMSVLEYNDNYKNKSREVADMIMCKIYVFKYFSCSQLQINGQKKKKIKNSNFVTRATRRVFLPAVFFWTRAERGAKTKWKGKKNTRLVSQVANIALCYNEVRKDRYHWDTIYDMVQAIV